MLIVGIIIGVTLVCGALVIRRSRTAHPAKHRETGAMLLVLAVAVAAIPLALSSGADAAIVPTVPLGTSENYAVLGGSTVTNTGNSVLNGSLGLSPGSSITGFPPGQVVPPATTDNNNPAAAQAQLDLTAAYIDAAGRPLDATTTADLADLVLVGGVYAGPDKSPLGLTGPLVLDAEGDPTTVFIFQTDSTLITGSSSTVSLINGAQECNVFWQVGSSATLGTGSTFVGNILALTSITVTTDVTVYGRALARNGAVTLDDDTFVEPTCDLEQPTTTTTEGPATTTTTEGPGTTTTTEGPGTTTTTEGPGTTTTTEGPGTTTTTEGPGTTTTTEGPGTTEDLTTSTTTPPSSTTTTPAGSVVTTTTSPSGTPTTTGTGNLPFTGTSVNTLLLVAGLLLLTGTAVMVGVKVRKR